MRILLINPSTPSFISNKEFNVPLNMLYLGAVLKKAQHNVVLLDLNIYRWRQGIDSPELYDTIMTDAVARHRPQLIGIGCPFSGNILEVLQVACTIKRFTKTVPIVIGGIHPTLFPEEILMHNSCIDWIIIGEGESSLVSLVATIEGGDYAFETIDGFAYRVRGKIVVNPKRSFIANLDEIPFQAYDLIDIKDYYHNTSGWHNPRKLSINVSLPIISSRSCPMHCSFCSMFKVMGKRRRARSPQNVADEIEYLYNKFEHRHFSFMDDNLTFDKPQILELCNEILKRKMNIQFETPNGIAINRLDRDILDALVEAGLIRVSLAIESGSDHIRNIMGKHLSREKIDEIIGLTKRYKELVVRVFFIMGMPEETRETLEETYEMIKEIDVDIPIISNLIPYPGTKVFDQALRDKLFIEEVDVKNLWREVNLYLSTKRFFLKPYNLNVSDLHEYRERFDRLIETCIDKKIRERMKLNGHRNTAH